MADQVRGMILTVKRSLRGCLKLTRRLVRLCRQPHPNHQRGKRELERRIRSGRVALVVLITLDLQFLVENTRFGAQVRASVDNQAASAGLGIDVNRVFAITFALGAGLAGLGGALGIEILGLDPTFPLKYLVYFLLAVAVGGAGSIKGTAVAALVLGVFDVAGKYYVPQAGAFIIYALMIVLLTLFPHGLYGRRA